MTQDSEILQSIRSGENSRVLTYLYKVTLSKVRRYILKNGGNKEQANDIFQDAVVILFNQVRKNKFDEKYAVDAFIYSVSRNLWVNKIRRDRRISNYEDMGMFEDSAVDNGVLSDLITKERSDAVQRLFGKLNEKCRQILHYYNHEGLSMKQISEKLGYQSENVAKTNHYRCKQYLMKLISENKELENFLRS